MPANTTHHHQSHSDLGGLTCKWSHLQARKNTLQRRWIGQQAPQSTRHWTANLEASREGCIERRKGVCVCVRACVCPICMHAGQIDPCVRSHTDMAHSRNRSAGEWVNLTWMDLCLKKAVNHKDTHTQTQTRTRSAIK